MVTPKHNDTNPRAKTSELSSLPSSRNLLPFSHTCDYSYNNIIVKNSWGISIRPLHPSLNTRKEDFAGNPLYPEPVIDWRAASHSVDALAFFFTSNLIPPPRQAESGEVKASILCSPCGLPTLLPPGIPENSNPSIRLGQP